MKPLMSVAIGAYLLVRGDANGAMILFLVGAGALLLTIAFTQPCRYTILDDAKWSDGTDLTGDDFQFTYDTIMREDLPTNKLTYEDIVSTEVGTKTFSYTLSAPPTPMVPAAACPLFCKLLGKCQWDKLPRSH